MKKREINIIIAREETEWAKLEKCQNKYGMESPITESQRARWASLWELAKELDLTDEITAYSINKALENYHA